MKKNIILSFILAATVFTTSSVYAQMDKDSKKSSHTKKSYAPTKGMFTVAMNFGRGSFISSGVFAPSSNGNVNATPSFSTISTNGNDASNMIGAEGRYYLSDGFAVTLSGGATFSNVPSTLAIPAVVDATGTTVIPGYNAVVEDSRADVSVSVGAQWSFDVKSKKLFPYLGFAIPFNYARRSLYDPTVTFGNNGANIVDLGARHVNVNGVGLQAVAGVDYYFSNNFYLGASIKPVSFYYISNSRIPGPALPGLTSESYTISSFVQPLLSLGFKF